MSGSLTDKIIAGLFEVPKKRTVGMNIRIHGALRERYFGGMDNVEVLDVIGRALEAWFRSGKAMYV